MIDKKHLYLYKEYKSIGNRKNIKRAFLFKIKNTIYSILFVMIFIQIPLLHSEDLIKNGGFELLDNSMPKNWDGWKEGSITEKAYKGKYSLNISNTKIDWLGFEQVVPIDRKINRKITVSAFVKIEDVVKGSNDWSKARILVLFFDNNKKQIGGWPELGSWTGTFDWNYFEKSFSIPKGATSSKVMLCLDTCKGSMLVDEVKVVYGKPERKEDIYNLLENGSFEYGVNIPESWDFWSNGESYFVIPGHNSARCYYMHNNKPGYAFLNQTVKLDSDTIYKIEVSADYKVKNIIQGEKMWEKARVNIEFLDNNKKRLTDWPIVGEVVGTFTNWGLWRKVFFVPPKTAFMI